MAILAVSEDGLQGYQPDPIGEIALQSGLDPEVVADRVRTMLEAGTIRRVRQTLISTNLAPGALVAWHVPNDRLDAAFDFMFESDPFSGHVVLRSTDAGTPGAGYRLWTTLKVPQGFSLQKHVAYLADRVGAVSCRVMPAKALFALGVGHTRRRELQPGSRSEAPADVQHVEVVKLDESDWRVLVALKREFEPREIDRDLWQRRAAEAGCSLAEFTLRAKRLASKGLMGRFSTFLEHAKPLATGERVASYNALFHWAVPTGREIEAGREVGRHHVLTHAYWREGGPEFGNVNVMAVAHGNDKTLLLAHKAAIDAHLAECGIPVSYTNVFWGGRSEIKPSEIWPDAYREWCLSAGLDPDQMSDFSDGEA
jgi:DNA-binding Lrp family transcriptional regulator